ncbi:aspartate dehydrogenase domain-containing protein [Paenarthrobacter nitroguajacolicus]|uniref:aspartate dehydrogenase domain-containing protein n=1 Tax=Paenarthrobacter nitroguajacolicus TaxID=211146 RepID=UPI0015BB6EF3|nr:aspartate dehydrogenase domain-containing protein [Paenarthrobacter nitroguajacolicus]NWL12373.1 aspartate dehydrogenase [Paenarthrobacter nitroguajacolicus]NWL31713.1 aspartate dehydrogenase [Paenarthrobacter nitroguajacolicus]
MKPGARRIGIIGHGAIGARVAADIAAGKVKGATLEGIICRSAIDNAPAPQLEMEQALERCDLLVECAGQEVLVEHGEAVLSAGVDLLATSLGALADPHLSQRLSAAGPGRLFLTPGSIGGLDLLASGARATGYDAVRITTTKLPGSLIQPWMDEVEADRIRNTAGPIEIFAGSAARATQLFPKSLNVAAAVALAVDDWDAVAVSVRADPAAELTTHLIEASGNSGNYRFEICNKVSPQNPRTSGVVPFAVLRSLELIIGARGGMI